MARFTAKGLVLLGGLLGSLLLATQIGSVLQGPRWIVLYSGYIGSGLIILSMVYSVRKHWLAGMGSLKLWLALHEYTAFFGALLIFFHTARRFRAGVPSAALIMMTIVVASGFWGRELYLELTRYQKALNPSSGRPTALEFAIKRLRTWRDWHVQISVSLLVFVALHLVLVSYYGGLK